MEKEIDGVVVKLVGTSKGVSFYQCEDESGKTYIYVGDVLVSEIAGWEDISGYAYTKCTIHK